MSLTFNTPLNSHMIIQYMDTKDNDFCIFMFDFCASSCKREASDSLFPSGNIGTDYKNDKYKRKNATINNSVQFLRIFAPKKCQRI